MSTLSAINLKHPSAASNIALDASGNASLTGSLAMGSSFLRNRIQNGDMRIDQRNAGASVSIAVDNTSYFPADRCLIRKFGTQTVTAQRSTVAPTGFTNSALVTVTSGAAITSGTYFLIGQNIEGFNVADLGWGTASAQTVTMSFWARSSVAGTFNTYFSNNGDNRSYLANFTINATNTWEYKTVTVPGDTSGTWTTDNTSGLKIGIGLGGGTNFQAAPGSWASGTFLVSSTASNTFLTAANTFHLTGVQLEVGSVATPFERRQFGQELALCQRYYEQTPSLTTFANSRVAVAANTSVLPGFYFIVPKRAAPTLVIYSRNGTINKVSSINTGFDVGTNFTPNVTSTVGTHIITDGTAPLTAGQGFEFNYTANSEL